MKQPLFSPNLAGAVLAPAPEVLAGEIAAARGNYDSAIAHLERAVRLEDSLVYTEPSEFHYPPRHALGAILLEAGRPAEAETVYWEDLRRNQENGWALFGLLQALRAQNKTDDAALIEARFKKAWARADVTLTASRFGRAAAADARRGSRAARAVSSKAYRGRLGYAPSRPVPPAALAAAGCTAARPRRGQRPQADRHPGFASTAGAGTTTRRPPAPNLQRSIARGVRAEGLIPAFPPRPFRITTRSSPACIPATTASSPTPSATRRPAARSRCRRRQGSARSDVVGRRADLGGRGACRPARRHDVLARDRGADRRRAARRYWRPYDETDAGCGTRVDQVLELARPAGARRPTFLTLYFEDTDSAGHDAGPGLRGRQACHRARRWLPRPAAAAGWSDAASPIAPTSSSSRITGWPPRSERRSSAGRLHLTRRCRRIVDINPTLGIVSEAAGRRRRSIARSPRRTRICACIGAARRRGVALP